MATVEQGRDVGMDRQLHAEVRRRLQELDAHPVDIHRIVRQTVAAGIAGAIAAFALGVVGGYAFWKGCAR